MERPTREERCERFLQNANEAARHAIRVYLVFLLICAYVFIIIGSTTDEQLLRVSRVSLPLLDVGIPILAFYILMPWIVVLLHFNLLLQLYLLASKLHLFDAALGSITPATKQAEVQDAWCDEKLRFKIKGCLAATERSAYQDRLVSRLAALSCEDVSIARGIMRFRRGIMRFRIEGYSPSIFDRSLAAALLAKAEQSDCKGVYALSQEEKNRLKEFVKTSNEEEKKKRSRRIGRNLRSNQGG